MIFLKIEYILYHVMNSFVLDAKLNSRRYFLPVFVTIELLLALAIPFMLIEGYHSILGSKAGQFVVEAGVGDPNWRVFVESTPIVAAVETNGGKVSGVTLLINGEIDAEPNTNSELTKTGTAIVIPATVTIQGKTLDSQTPEQAVEALSSELRLGFQSVETFEFGVVMESLKEHIDTGEWKVKELPLVEKEPVTSSSEEQQQNQDQDVENPIIVTVIDLQKSEEMIHSSVPFPSSPVHGGRLPLKILKGSPEINIESFAAELGGKGFEITEIGNLGSFDEKKSRVIIPRFLLEGSEVSPLLPEEVRRLESLLSLQAVYDEESEEDVVTVIVGEDPNS